MKTLIESTKELYNDIDRCIDKLLQGRKNNDPKQEIDAIVEMESLLVATQQQLTCILDKLSEENISDESTCEGYPLWQSDLIRCPSQCYCEFEGDDQKYCIYLRWRWDDPWTAAIVPCDNYWEWDNITDWEYLDVPFYTHDEHVDLKEKCEEIVKSKFKHIKWNNET